jgi:anti-sigma-K factor RskA
MISEEKQDQAIAYVFGELSPAQQEAFESELQREPELQAFVGEMRESLGLLAQTAQEATPPAHLKARIMALTRKESDSVPVPRMEIPAPSGPRAPVAWMAFSAVLLLVAMAAAIDDWSTRTRYDSQKAQIASVKQELDQLRGNLESQRQQIAAIEAENSLSQMRVVTLDPQAAPLGNAKAVVIWNAKQQQGMIKGDHFSGAGNGKDYQLWVIDPSAPAPVSAGVITVSGDGTFVTTFKPVHPVNSAAKFAISVEATGGSVTPRGPIVFVGG